MNFCIIVNTNTKCKMEPFQKYCYKFYDTFPSGVCNSSGIKVHELQKFSDDALLMGPKRDELEAMYRKQIEDIERLLPTFTKKSEIELFEKERAFAQMILSRIDEVLSLLIEAKIVVEIYGRYYRCYDHFQYMKKNRRKQISQENMISV